MEERQTLFLWALVSGGFGAALGTAFGATVGAITWRDGRVAGTFIGFGLARAYERAVRCELAAATKGAVVGGTDGAVFLGTVGILVGALVAWRVPRAADVLVPTAVVMVLLLALGSLFGSIAFALVRTGTRAVVPIFFAAMFGAGIGVYCGRLNGLFIGLVLGLVAGTAVAVLRGPRRS
jgi:hypothetical protein